MSDIRVGRIAEVLRDVARGGFAGALAGIVVGGLGGRLVMSLIAQLNQDALGMGTEAGAIIGRFTLSGTLALMTFSGLGSGIVAGVLWVIIRPWLPSSSRRRMLLGFPIAIGLGSFLLIESTNFDFGLVGPTWLVLILLVGLVGLAGVATAWFEDRLETRLPPVASRPGRSLAIYAVVAILGLPGFLLTVMVYFDEGFSTGRTPPGVGLALAAVGVATASLWVRRVVTGATVPPAPLVIAARIAVVAAVLLGALHIALEVGRIYAKV